MTLSLPVRGKPATSDSGRATSFWTTRARLLSRDATVSLAAAQLRDAAVDLYGRADAFRLYGLDIDELDRRGMCVLGRTAVECCLDVGARPLGAVVRREWRAVAGPADGTIVDAFAGSGNLLFWVMAHTGMPGVGFELDAAVHGATRTNLMRLGSSARLIHDSFANARRHLASEPHRGRIYLLDPPWGPAFDPATGLDITRTTPPIDELVESLRSGCEGPTLVVLKAPDRLTTVSRRWLTGLSQSGSIDRLRRHTLGYGYVAYLLWVR
jgi:hypothetical protein